MTACFLGGEEGEVLAGRRKRRHQGTEVLLVDRLVERVEIAVELEEVVELGHELYGNGAARGWRSGEAGGMRVAGELTIAGGSLASSRGQGPRA